MSGLRDFLCAWFHDSDVLKRAMGDRFDLVDTRILDLRFHSLIEPAMRLDGKLDRRKAAEISCSLLLSDGDDLDWFRHIQSYVGSFAGNIWSNMIAEILPGSDAYEFFSCLNDVDRVDWLEESLVRYFVQAEIQHLLHPESIVTDDAIMGIAPSSHNISKDGKLAIDSTNVRSGLLISSAERFDDRCTSFSLAAHRIKGDFEQATGAQLDDFLSYCGDDESRAYLAGGSVTRRVCHDADSSHWKTADFDVFFVSENPESHATCLDRGLDFVRLCWPSSVVAHHEHVVDVHIGDATIQFVLRKYRSLDQILVGFDIDACCFAYGASLGVRSIPRGIKSVTRRIIIVDPSRHSASFAWRLKKYRNRSFDVLIPMAEERCSRLLDADARLDIPWGLANVLSVLMDKKKSRSKKQHAKSSMSFYCRRVLLHKSSLTASGILSDDNIAKLKRYFGDDAVWVWYPRLVQNAPIVPDSAWIVSNPGTQCTGSFVPESRPFFCVP